MLLSNFFIETMHAEEIPFLSSYVDMRDDGQEVKERKKLEIVDFSPNWST